MAFSRQPRVLCPSCERAAQRSRRLPVSLGQNVAIDPEGDARVSVPKAPCDGPHVVPLSD